MWPLLYRDWGRRQMRPACCKLQGKRLKNKVGRAICKQKAPCTVGGEL